MKRYVKLLLLLFVPLAVAVMYSLSSYQCTINFTIEKLDLSKLKSGLTWNSNSPENSVDTMNAVAMTDTIEDTQELDSVAIAFNELLAKRSDSTKIKIMFFGDSMLEGLSRRFNDYAVENHYDLNTVVWYSSSTKLWAETDTLQYFMRKIKPDYFVLCLGSNELFVNDLSKREQYIAKILKKMGDKPFVWISPPNWTEDTGINDVIIKSIGLNHYFDSRSLELKRGSDHAHPTFGAAEIWMDSVAVWMNSKKNAVPLPMSSLPAQKHERRSHLYLLQPVDKKVK